jgi:hypothetical protein
LRLHVKALKEAQRGRYFKTNRGEPAVAKI